jgi:hypothetical protein
MSSCCRGGESLYYTTHKELVSHINWSIREDMLPGFPRPPTIGVEKAIEIDKALDHREELTEKYVRRFPSTTAQALIAFDDLELAKEFHNRFLENLRRGRS